MTFAMIVCQEVVVNVKTGNVKRRVNNMKEIKLSKRQQRLRREDLFSKIFVFMLQYGTLLFIALMNITYHTFTEPNEDMFTRGVVVMCTFLILVEIRFFSSNKGEKQL